VRALPCVTPLVVFYPLRWAAVWPVCAAVSAVCVCCSCVTCVCFAVFVVGYKPCVCCCVSCGVFLCDLCVLCHLCVHIRTHDTLLQLGTPDLNRASGRHVDEHLTTCSSEGGMTPTYDFLSPSNTPDRDLNHLHENSTTCSSEGVKTPVYDFQRPIIMPAYNSNCMLLPSISSTAESPPHPLTPAPSPHVTHGPRALQFPQIDSIESENDTDKHGATGLIYVF
jgi:hypothetical protein